MGKGKGSFDHWATRVAVNQIVLELKGMVHEQVVRDAFRLAGGKLPGKSQRTPQASKFDADPNSRPMGVREEGSTPNSRHHQTGRYYA